jgi:hypothetical protein
MPQRHNLRSLEDTFVERSSQRADTFFTVSMNLSMKLRFCSCRHVAGASPFQPLKVVSFFVATTAERDERKASIPTDLGYDASASWFDKDDSLIICHGGPID